MASPLVPAACLSFDSIVQLEIGNGLRQREKRAFKQQILDRVRKCCAFDVESATIVADVL